MLRARTSLPSAITFVTLICGMSAIALAIDGEITYAGALILLGYLLDAADGEIARRLRVSSEFGIHLDSLVDMVNFGVGNAVLVNQHLRQSPLQGWPIWIPTIFFVMAGAFRLARFNLNAAKGKQRDSMGLTISTGGAFVTLTVLSDHTAPEGMLPDWAYIPLLLAVALLMASRIRFPEFQTLIRNRWADIGILVACVAMAVFLRPVVVWLGLTTGYISFGVARALLRSF